MHDFNQLLYTLCFQIFLIEFTVFVNFLVHGECWEKVIHISLGEQALTRVPFAFTK